MMKAIVFDKDGSLYSASSYADAFAMHLNRHFEGKDCQEYMLDYYLFKGRAVIGKSYNPKTLREKKDGTLLKTAFWLPSIVALKHGFNGDFKEEFHLFFSYIFGRQRFMCEPMLQTILQNKQYSKALVSNCTSPEPLYKLDAYKHFNLVYLDADKRTNLDDICCQIEDRLAAKPSETFWVEDDVAVLDILSNKGYETVLRKTYGFNYLPDSELNKFSRLILEDNLVQIAHAMNKRK